MPDAQTRSWTGSTPGCARWASPDATWTARWCTGRNSSASPSVWLVRRLQNEHVAFAFEQRGQVTDVRATGKLRDRAHAEVTEALGGR